MSKPITTQYDPPPVPSRAYDWSAYRGDPDYDMHISYGATEAEAIENLRDWEEMVQA